MNKNLALTLYLILKLSALALSVLIFSGLVSAGNAGENMPGFEAVCMEYKEGERGLSFSDFLDNFILRIEKSHEERAFMLIYNMPIGSESFDDLHITVGVAVDRFISVESPLFIRIFDDMRVKVRQFSGSEGAFISFYSLILEEFGGKHDSLGGIPVIVFDAEEYIKTGRFDAAVHVPVR